jgi:hypothetical protein
MQERSLAPDRRTDHPPRECSRCAAYGAPSGSVSAGTDRQPVGDKETGEMRHVVCGPIASLLGLTGMVSG